MARPSGVVVISETVGKTTPDSLRLPPPLIREISEFSIAEATDFGVGLDGFGAVGAFSGACGIAEGTFLERALVVFDHLLDALRIPFGVAVAVDLVGPA